VEWVRLVARWTLALLFGAAVFTGVWWLCEKQLGKSAGDAIGIAAAAGCRRG
jgi:hypothetical protein